MSELFVPRSLEELAGPEYVPCVVMPASHTQGYARVTVDGRRVFAHRYAYEQVFGPIPAGLHLDHLCRMRGCINPWHLEAVTPQENVARGIPRNGNKDKTHCKRGHEFTEENTYRHPKRGTRHCRKCQSERHQQWLGRREVVV